MNAPEERKSARVASPVPRGGFLAMSLILLALALLSVYANVQKSRRDQIEKVTITRAPASAAQPSASPAPATQ